MRNMAAKVALECEADYLLFLDDDVLVPPNNALKLLLECEADVAAGKFAFVVILSSTCALWAALKIRAVFTLLRKCQLRELKM